jgi:hypothetical protein
MKTASFLLAALVALAAAAAADARDEKNPLPGKAAWDLKPLQRSFRIQATTYDAGQRQVKWTVELRDGVRTADFVRALRTKPFTFTFLDGADNELAIIQLQPANFRGIPQEATLKEGTRLEVVLTVPKSMERVKTVKLTR